MRALPGPLGVVGSLQSTVARAPGAGGWTSWHTSALYPRGNSAISFESNVSGFSVAVVVRGVRLVVRVASVVSELVAVGPAAEDSSGLTSHQTPNAPRMTTKTRAAAAIGIHG